MKQSSSNKMTRGQMVYAPISAGQRGGKSPFGNKASSRSLIRGNEQQVNSPQRNNHLDIKNVSSNNKQQESVSKKQVTTLMSSPPKMGRVSSSSQKNQVYQQSQLYQQLNILSSSSPRANSSHQQNFISFTGQSTRALANNNISPYQNSQIQIQSLKKQNQILLQREQVYIQKLVKLQQGLYRQHEQFMNLQQLYTQLFNVYKQKEEEFAELEMKYKEGESFVSNGSFRQYGGNGNDSGIGGHFGQITLKQQLQQKEPKQQQQQKSQFNQQQQQHKNSPNILNSAFSSPNSHQFAIFEQAFKQQLSQLIYQNKRLNQTNQKLLTELNYLKSKHNLQSSKQFLQNKFILEITDTQKLLQQQKQHKLQLQYQNKYLQMRTEDLQKNVAQLQGIIAIKQSQIMKTREQKMNIRKHSSQKILNKSPPRQSDSARSKSSNTQKKYNKLIDNLQKENQKLRQQNFNLKQNLKNSRINNIALQKQQSSRVLLAESHYTEQYQKQQQNISIATGKKLNFTEQTQQKRLPYHQNNIHPYRQQQQNENFNSQNFHNNLTNNNNQQYFSFSRQRQDKLSEQDLPCFPMDLEIQSIIRKHQQKDFNKQAKGDYHQNEMENNQLQQNQEQYREQCPVTQ